VSNKELDPTVLVVKRFDAQDPRLGRHVVHDSRSLRYRFHSQQNPMMLASVRHQIHVPILDQGMVGSCTGHAGTAVLGHEKYWRAASAVLQPDAGYCHNYAVGLYSDATKLDPWPGEYLPTDTGSDGLSIAKVLLARGLISGYQHATNLNATLNALAEQPVMIGTSWLSGMFDPASDGRLHVTGTNEGGHEYVLDELDVPRQRVWMRNSWNTSWGVQGRAWMSWADLSKLLADYGDVTVLVPLTEPPPEPQKPTPRIVDANMAEALRRLLDNKSCPAYIRPAARAWLEDLASKV